MSQTNEVSIYLLSLMNYSTLTNRKRYDTRHGVLILFSLETYNLYSIASQLKRLFDPTTFGISPTGKCHGCGTFHSVNVELSGTSGTLRINLA